MGAGAALLPQITSVVFLIQEASHAAKEGPVMLMPGNIRLGNRWAEGDQELVVKVSLLQRSRREALPGALVA